MSVPLTDTASLGTTGGANRASSPDSAPGSLQAQQAQSQPQPQAGSLLPQTGEEVLTVSAGEPVTHFNLDQLLEIVQSFQLDTTLAGNDDPSVQQQIQMVLANDASLAQVNNRRLLKNREIYLKDTRLLLQFMVHCYLFSIINPISTCKRVSFK